MLQALFFALFRDTTCEKRTEHKTIEQPEICAKHYKSCFWYFNFGIIALQSKRDWQKRKITGRRVRFSVFVNEFACREPKGWYKMKKRAGMTAAAGLLTVVGAAGGAESAPLWQTVLCMAAGFALMLYAEYTASKRRRGHWKKRTHAAGYACAAPTAMPLPAAPNTHLQNGSQPACRAAGMPAAGEGTWRKRQQKHSPELC